jgi:hypothetical protein
MSTPNQDEAISRSSGNSIFQNERVRRVVLYAAGLLIVFLLGLVPMWVTARSRARERDAAQASLRISSLQNTLGSAAIDARRGEYEPARRAASEFFTNLQAEIDRGDSGFNLGQQNTLRSLFQTRDDTITLLARSDPASADQLVVLHVKYRQALENASGR